MRPSNVQGVTALLVAATVVVAVIRGGAAGWQEPPSQAPARSTQAGVYTAEQATRGQSTFGTICTGCHTTSTYSAPSFVRRWDGRPLGELYAIIADTMPEDAPGSLTAKESAQVLAYLLKLNRMPAGSEELPADADELQKIRFQTNPALTRGPTQ
jgi:mono/diheme cytochrome c family protein